MWAVVVTLLIALSVAGVLAAAWGRSAPPWPSVWDLPRSAGSYMGIVGMLGSASIVSSIFIANLSVAREADEFASVMGMFIIAFFVLIGAAMEYASTPNRADVVDEDYLRIQRYAYFMANVSYLCGLMISWSGLRLLVLAIDLDYVADVLTWVLLVSLLAGLVRQSQALLRLSGNAEVACMVIPLLAFAAAATYRLVLVPNFDGLRPPRDEALLFTLICFALTALGFAAQSSLTGAWGRERETAFIRRYGDRLMLAWMQAMATSLAMLYLVVVKT